MPSADIDKNFDADAHAEDEMTQARYTDSRGEGLDKNGRLYKNCKKKKCKKVERIYYARMKKLGRIQLKAKTD